MDKKFNLGDKVWVIDSDEDAVSYILVGTNDEYAFLSPIIGCPGDDITDAHELCEHYYNEFTALGNEAELVVVPLTECYATREEAEASLRG